MWLLEKFKLHMVSHLWLTLWLCWAALFQTKQISHRDVKWLSQDSSASISRPQVWFYITEFTAISLNIQPLAKDFFFFFDYGIGFLMVSGSLKTEVSLKNTVSTSSVIGCAFSLFFFPLSFFSCYCTAWETVLLLSISCVGYRNWYCI